MIERMNLTTGKGFGDGEHILYVNGQYPGESDLWKLMHDYNCTEADNMNFDLMAEHTRYLKENPKRVQEMCKAMEDMRNEAGYYKATEIAKRMIARGKATLEEIAEDTGLALNKIQELSVKIGM